MFLWWIYACDFMHNKHFNLDQYFPGWIISRNVSVWLLAWWRASLLSLPSCLSVVARLMIGLPPNPSFMSQCGCSPDDWPPSYPFLHVSVWLLAWWLASLLTLPSCLSVVARLMIGFPPIPSFMSQCGCSPDDWPPSYPFLHASVWLLAWWLTSLLSLPSCLSVVARLMKGLPPIPSFMSQCGCSPDEGPPSYPFLHVSVWLLAWWLASLLSLPSCLSVVARLMIGLPQYGCSPDDWPPSVWLLAWWLASLVWLLSWWLASLVWLLAWWLASLMWLLAWWLAPFLSLPSCLSVVARLMIGLPRMVARLMIGLPQCGCSPDDWPPSCGCSPDDWPPSCGC